MQIYSQIACDKMSIFSFYSVIGKKNCDGKSNTAERKVDGHENTIENELSKMILMKLKGGGERKKGEAFVYTLNGINIYFTTALFPHLLQRLKNVCE